MDRKTSCPAASNPMTARIRLLALALLACTASLPVRAGQVQVAVASNVAAPIRAIAEDFQQKTGNTVVLPSAPTSQPYAQIRQGAEYDVSVAGDRKSAVQG